MDSSVIFSLFSVIELPRTAFYHVSQIGWFKFADLQIYGKVTNAYIPHMLIDRYMIWRFHLFATVQIRWQFHYTVLQSLVIMPQQFWTCADRTAAIPCVKMVATTLQKFRREEKEILIEFELWGKYRQWQY